MAGLSNLFTELGQLIDGSYQSSIGSILTQTSGFAVSISGACIVIYVILFGIASMMGKVTEPWSEFIGRMAKPAVVIALAGSLYVVVFNLPQLQTDMVQMVSGTSAYTQLDQAMQSAQDETDKRLGVSQQVWDEARSAAAWDWYNAKGATGVDAIGPMIGDYVTGAVVAVFWILIGLLFLVAVFLLVVGAAFTVVIADVFLHIAFAIGPVFVIALISPYTSRLFESWSGFALAQVFKWFFASIVIILAMSAFVFFLGKIDADAGSLIGMKADPVPTARGQALASEALLAWPAAQVWFDVAGLLIIAAIMNKIILEVSALAGSIGGGFSAQAMSFGQVMALASGAKAALAPGRGSSPAGGAARSGGANPSDLSPSSPVERARMAIADRRIYDDNGGGKAGLAAVRTARRDAMDASRMGVGVGGSARSDYIARSKPDYEARARRAMGRWA